MQVSYKPSFIKEMHKLEKSLFNEVLEKIDFLKTSKDYSVLKVHKLNGKLKDFYSFSVNYKIRIIFKYESKKEIVLLNIGSHDIYK